MRKILKYLSIFILLLAIVIVGTRVIYRNDISQMETLKKEVFIDNKVLKRSLDFKRLKKHCPKLEALLIDEPKNYENLARNRHFEKDGEIYRLRTFIEDGENTSFTKLVYYKEDKDGFPRIIKLPKGKEINPSEEYIKSFLKGAKVIHLEEDTRVTLSDGREITYSSINGNIVKINSEQDDCKVQK